MEGSTKAKTYKKIEEIELKLKKKIEKLLKITKQVKKIDSKEVRNEKLMRIKIKNTEKKERIFINSEIEMRTLFLQLRDKLYKIHSQTHKTKAKELMEEIINELQEELEEEDKAILEMKKYFNNWLEETEKEREEIKKLIETEKTYSKKKEWVEYAREEVPTFDKKIISKLENFIDIENKLQKTLEKITSKLHLVKKYSTILFIPESIKEETIITDSEFFKELQDSKPGHQILIEDSNLSKKNTIIIPSKVIEESRSANNKYRRGLIRQDSLNEFIRANDAKINTLEKKYSEYEIDQMKKIWQKNQKGEPWEKFRRGADFIILNHIKTNPSKKFLVITGDKDYANFRHAANLSNMKILKPKNIIKKAA